MVVSSGCLVQASYLTWICAGRCGDLRPPEESAPAVACDLVAYNLSATAGRIVIAALSGLPPAPWQEQLGTTVCDLAVISDASIRPGSRS